MFSKLFDEIRAGSKLTQLSGRCEREFLLFSRLPIWSK
jgi:hypothetical protein